MGHIGGRSRWVLLLALVGCGDDGAAVSDAPKAIDGAMVDALPPDAPFQKVNVSMAAGRDEDSTVFRASNNFVYVVWFSEMTGGGDIYLRRSLDGETWEPAVQVTSGADVDFYPNIVEASDHTFHLVAHRRTGSRGGVGNIVHVTSTDFGAHWSAATAITAYTTGDGAWSPSIAILPSGKIVVVYVENLCGATPCFKLLSKTSMDGVAWVDGTVPAPSNTLQDHLPMLARTENYLTLTWNRFASSPGHELPYLTPTSEVFLSTAGDDMIWSAPTQFTNNAEPDLFPAIYVDHDDAAWLTWQTATGSFEKPAKTPVIERTIPNVSGYFPRVVETHIPDRYVVASVIGQDPEEEIEVSAFTR